VKVKETVSDEDWLKLQLLLKYYPKHYEDENNISASLFRFLIARGLNCSDRIRMYTRNIGVIGGRIFYILLYGVVRNMTRRPHRTLVDPRKYVPTAAKQSV